MPAILGLILEALTDREVHGTVRSSHSLLQGVSLRSLIWGAAQHQQESLLYLVLRWLPSTAMSICVTD